MSPEGVDQEERARALGSLYEYVGQIGVPLTAVVPLVEGVIERKPLTTASHAISTRAPWACTMPEGEGPVGQTAAHSSACHGCMALAMAWAVEAPGLMHGGRSLVVWVRETYPDEWGPRRVIFERELAARWAEMPDGGFVRWEADPPEAWLGTG